MREVLRKVALDLFFLEKNLAIDLCDPIQYTLY